MVAFLGNTVTSSTRSSSTRADLGRSESSWKCSKNCKGDYIDFQFLSWVREDPSTLSSAKDNRIIEVHSSQINISYKWHLKKSLKFQLFNLCFLYNNLHLPLDFSSLNSPQNWLQWVQSLLTDVLLGSDDLEINRKIPYEKQ